MTCYNLYGQQFWITGNKDFSFYAIFGVNLSCHKPIEKILKEKSSINLGINTKEELKDIKEQIQLTGLRYNSLDNPFWDKSIIFKDQEKRFWYKINECPRIDFSHYSYPFIIEVIFSGEGDYLKFIQVIKELRKRKYYTAYDGDGKTWNAFIPSIIIK